MVCRQEMSQLSKRCDGNKESIDMIWEAVIAAREL